MLFFRQLFLFLARRRFSESNYCGYFSFPKQNKTSFTQLKIRSKTKLIVFYNCELYIKKREKVLEVGTGSGYQACVLAEMGARVYTVERYKSLHNKAQQMFDLLGYKGIRTYYRDGYKGLAEFAPFEKILVTAAAPYIPEALKAQLTIKGILVIPVGDRTGQRMHKITRLSENRYVEEILESFRFVPMKKGKV